MKNLFLFLCLFVCMLSCKKEFEVAPPSDDFSTVDGCSKFCYVYNKSPIAGDYASMCSLVDFAKVESVVYPITGDTSINKLSQRLVSPFSKSYEKIYAIYYWITLNMRYDYVMLDNGYHCDWQNSSTVLQRKLGVCEGLSNLFCALCKSAKIPVVKIWGYVPTPDGGYHAWNAVQIDGEWFLLDVTWDLMYKTKGKTYFLANPQTFYYKHIPDDLKWKLF